MFDKKKMVDWENKPILIKDNYIKAKLYFEQLIKDFKQYTQNSGRMSAKQGYRSAIMVANIGNKLQKYIQEIVSMAAVGNECQSEWVTNISEET
jgi:hypothetical protein